MADQILLAIFNGLRSGFTGGERIGAFLANVIRFGRKTADDADLFTTLSHVSDETLAEWIEGYKGGRKMKAYAAIVMFRRSDEPPRPEAEALLGKAIPAVCQECGAKGWQTARNPPEAVRLCNACAFKYMSAMGADALIAAPLGSGPEGATPFAAIKSFLDEDGFVKFAIELEGDEEGLVYASAMGVALDQFPKLSEQLTALMLELGMQMLAHSMAHAKDVTQN